MILGRVVLCAVLHVLISHSTVEDLVNADDTMNLLQVGLHVDGMMAVEHPGQFSMPHFHYASNRTRVWDMSAKTYVPVGAGTVRSFNSSRITLDAVSVDGRNISGFNPSIVDMPEHLREFFPDGRWLAALRSGPDRCFGFNQSLAPFNAPYRTHLAVLDNTFSILTRTNIEVQHADSFEAGAINDGRLLLRQNGDIFIGFIPYSLEDPGSPHARHTGDRRDPLTLNFTDSWSEIECVAKLHVSAVRNGSQQNTFLHAHVDRLAMRAIHECPERGMHAPGPKKNLGFFEHNEQVYALDWIGPPTSVGPLDLDSLVTTNSSEIEPLCFGLLPSELNSSNDMDPLRSTDYFRENLHNGPHPIWVEEAGVYLGIAHIKRRFSLEENWFEEAGVYTHVFFALSGQPPFSIQSVSREFCFESQQVAGACEQIQFASSISRDAGNLVIGYGVEDCESYVAIVSLNQTLQELMPLANVIQ